MRATQFSPAPRDLPRGPFAALRDRQTWTRALYLAAAFPIGWGGTR